MSFASPAFLISLGLIPLVLAWYYLNERRRRRVADAFASPATRVSALPRRPGWRRHVPAALFALALAALAVALAKPEQTVAVPDERASIVIVTDHSGSMLAEDVDPNRQVAALRAAERFLDDVPDRVRVGVVAFNHIAQALRAPTTDRQAVRDALRSLRPSGSTATGDGLAAALRLIENLPRQGGRRPPAAVVLISDGKSVRGRDPIQVAGQADRQRVPVYTVALGTPEGTIRSGDRDVPVPPDPDTLRRMSEISDGESFSADDAEGLNAAYDRLGSQVAYRKEKRERTAVVAGGALVLLLGGAGLSLAWFGRPA
jgi:Ca-activated chloride channel family protein